MRIVFFIVLIAVTVAVPWWLVVPLWAVYALRYVAYELVVLGIALDAYFGMMMPWHVVYTVSAFVVCLGAEWLKPRMSLYDEFV